MNLVIKPSSQNVCIICFNNKYSFLYKRTVYTLTLDNMGLNSAGPLICGFFQ